MTHPAPRAARDALDSLRRLDEEPLSAFPERLEQASCIHERCRVAAPAVTTARIGSLARWHV